MDGFDRIYDLHKILSRRKTAVPLKAILQEMECSRATFNRIKRHMVEFLGAPIEYRRDEGGYIYNGDCFELPGTWFNQHELHALLVMQSLVNHLGEGLLAAQLAPIMEPLKVKLLQRSPAKALPAAALDNKVVVVNAISRPITHRFFGCIVTALYQEKTLALEYFARSTQQTSQRTVSPQRIVLYQGCWYLDCWCHTRSALRTFSVESIQAAGESAEAFIALEPALLQTTVSASYGIFTGEPNAMASLLFTGNAALWAADEQWHPKQKRIQHNDGSLQLDIPFHTEKSAELVRDILRYGPDATVLSPEALQHEVKQKLLAAFKNYQPPATTPAT